MRGVVVKCSFDRLRRATDEEWLGAELVKILSSDALERMQRQGQRGYVDTSGEEPPPEDVQDSDYDKLIVDPNEHLTERPSPIPEGRLLASVPEDEPVDVQMEPVWVNRPEYQVAPTTPRGDTAQLNDDQSPDPSLATEVTDETMAEPNVEPDPNTSSRPSTIGHDSALPVSGRWLDSCSQSSINVIRAIVTLRVHLLPNGRQRMVTNSLSQ